MTSADASVFEAGLSTTRRWRRSVEKAGNPSLVKESMTAYYRHEEGPLSLQSPALVELARGVLARGQSFRFCAPGTSMSPFLQDGDILTIAPIATRPISIGDIVAFVPPGGDGLVVHRVITLREDALLTKGDNVPVRDTLIPLDSVVGIVVCAERGGAGVRVGLGPERTIIALLSRWNCLRPFIGAVAPLVRAARRFF